MIYVTLDIAGIRSAEDLWDLLDHAGVRCRKGSRIQKPEVMQPYQAIAYPVTHDGIRRREWVTICKGPS